MSYAQASKDVDKIEKMLETASFTGPGYAAEIMNRGPIMQNLFFDLAINFIHEVAGAHPGDIYTVAMRINQDIAKDMVRGLNKQA